MKLQVRQNLDHYIKDMFAAILSAQSRMKSEIEYEGLFQIVAAELRAAKYCWDELFKKAEEDTSRIAANPYEIELRSKVAALMHSTNILVEAEHMVEQKYTFPSTEFILEVTLREVREEFDRLTEIITKTLHSREVYKRNKVLKDFFLLWDGGRHMHAFE